MYRKKRKLIYIAGCHRETQLKKLSTHVSSPILVQSTKEEQLLRDVIATQ